MKLDSNKILRSYAIFSYGSFNEPIEPIFDQSLSDVPVSMERVEDTGSIDSVSTSTSVSSMIVENNISTIGC